MQLADVPALFLVGTALLSSACMGGARDGSSGALIARVTITETDYHLSPGTVNLDRPGNYVLHVVNRGRTEHGLEISGPNVDGSLETVDPGQAGDLSVTVPQPGTYDLFSPQGDDRSRGMAGTLVVKGG